MTCQDAIQRGPRAGHVCGRHATMIFVPGPAFVCGIHARAYVKHALARIAYWRPKERAWL